MTDTKKPATVETATAPLGRPYAETVSLEVVWAAAYAAAYVREELNTYKATRAANEAVEDLLATHPRGGHV